MVYRVVSTFDPEKLVDNRYTLVFDNLRKSGVKVDILPDVDPKNLEGILSTYKERISGADMVFHIPAFTHSQLYWAYETDFRAWTQQMSDIGHSWTSDEYDELQTERRGRESDFKQRLNESVGKLKDSGVIIDADVFLQDGGEVYATLDAIGLPRIKRMTVEEWEANKSFPTVLKMKNTSQGRGIYLLDNEDQFRKLFDKEYAEALVQGQFGFCGFSSSKDYFDVSEFIECPSDHYTHYRVFTLGEGTVLGAILSYSARRKNDDERIAVDDVNIHDVYDDVKSPLFLNRRKIVSNKGNGGSQIPLNPNDASREITNYERALLEEHGITGQQLPERLMEQATTTAKAFGERGLYVLGQDWIQGKDGKFYCLEINTGAGFGIFDTLYNYGRGDENVARTIAAEKITNGILGHLERKVA